MKKFRAVFKKKQNLSEQLHEKEVLESFKSVYNTLLDKYNTSNFKTLQESHQAVFLAELHSYWDDKKGLLPKGKKFLTGNSDMLNESSTSDQKRNYMKKRTVPAISETLRQSGLKWKLYDVIDEMYKTTGSENLGDVLDPKVMTEVLVESFRESVKSFMTEVKFELTENAKPQGSKKNLSESKKPKKKLKKVDEGIFNRKPKSIGDPEADRVAAILIDALSQEGIEASVGPDGLVRAGGKVLGSITPRGYVDVAGFGNWAPEEIEDDLHNIILGMQGNLEGVY